ncbi:MAG: hypothetical protein COB41_06095 [Proteobacteria bacterium]|nr:MAG: hypothetical protein COB41_06095 [Pseudomonadota bacterium]
MKRNNMIGIVMGVVFLASPVAFAGDQSSMSDSQHRKTMSGMHHPERGHDANATGDKAVMSNAQHRKTMSGMSHPKHANDGNKAVKKGSPTMSNTQHRKTMSGLSHSAKD